VKPPLIIAVENMEKIRFKLGMYIMEVWLNKFVKANGVNALLIVFILVLSIGSSHGARPVFSIELFNRPLNIYAFPVQFGQAHSAFIFDLKPFLSVVQPEIDYQVTNNLSRTLTNIGLMELPPGLTQIYEGEGVCHERFILGSNQRCILRLSFDKDKYNPALSGGPIICHSPPSKFLCSRPSAASQIGVVLLRTPKPTELQVIADDQNGLRYEPASMSIVGEPINPGVYHFQIIATNDYATAAPRYLDIEVSVNPKDKPLFKKNYTIPSAMPEHDYRLNLLDLIQVRPSFMVSNQISFRIDDNQDHPSWLSIDKDNGNFLHGFVPPGEAGKNKSITLFASSNAGGDSAPLTITIPVAYDPNKKPIIKNDIQLIGEAGSPLRYDFRANITDPTADNSLKIILDEIEPAAPWLSISSLSPTELNGIVPEGAVGQEYLITLHANTTIGGSSNAKIIPLNIAMNKNQTPRFYAANPQLTVLYPGQSYSYDFVENNDVYPEYRDIPYVVELADGYNNPAWLRVEHNRLVVDRVPDHLDQVERVFITIKNVPGGKSKVLPLSLFIMN
jgi:hypothetical protein